MRASGAPKALIAHYEAPLSDAGMFEVWPDNWDTVQLFLAVSSQLRIGGMGGVLGLDYPAVDVAVKFLGLSVSPEMFSGLQVMERVLVVELNKSDKAGVS